MQKAFFKLFSLLILFYSLCCIPCLGSSPLLVPDEPMHVYLQNVYRISGWRLELCCVLVSSIFAHLRFMSHFHFLPCQTTSPKPTTPLYVFISISIAIPVIRILIFGSIAFLLLIGGSHEWHLQQALPLPSNTSVILPLYTYRRHFTTSIGK
jgi:hypothetical protein